MAGWSFNFTTSKGLHGPSLDSEAAQFHPTMDSASHYAWMQDCAEQICRDFLARAAANGLVFTTINFRANNNAGDVSKEFNVTANWS